MTHFLSKAQGMPKSIETAITKKICTFIWNDRKSPPISLARLERPVSEGGLGLLNISARNEAIEITWVQAFMDLSNSRPAWAFIADNIINSLKPDTIKDQPEINSLLTSWDPPTRGTKANRLPRHIINLIKTTKKHNVSLAPLKLLESLKNQMPAWYHLGAPQKTYHRTKDKCLKDTHNAMSI
ncbi:hypothetical protein DFH29DRAFT_797434, partial [Suillus ampliporus]